MRLKRVGVCPDCGAELVWYRQMYHLKFMPEFCGICANDDCGSIFEGEQPPIVYEKVEQPKLQEAQL
ncbi:MAG TPA: hypothetical protein VIK14_17780 [Ignavibacteria bacterium]